MRYDNTCDECWAGEPVYQVDAGMFGEKDVCLDCYANHYRGRRIVAKLPHQEERTG